VVAPDDGRWPKFLNTGDDRVRVGPIADEIAEDEHLIVTPRSGVGQARLERFEVCVYVGEDEVSHV
jgi:hypothetical protein